MPKGMVLKSEAFASGLYDPTGLYDPKGHVTLRHFVPRLIRTKAPISKSFEPIVPQEASRTVA
jgi:hypothetical protein